MILAAIAAIVLGVYFNSPCRFFVEDVFAQVKDGIIIAYDDKTDGGSSEVQFKRNGSAADFECTLGTDENKGAWCGLLMDLIVEDTLYRDWTFVDSVIVNLESSGTNEILLKIWTFDPEVTDVKVPRSFRLLMKEIPLTGGAQRVSIPLEQFYTPDFWYEDAKVDRTLECRHHETVARVEIAPGWNHPRGKKFSLSVKSIEVKGLSNFWFGVVLFIFLGLTIIAVGYRHHKKNEND